MNDWLLFLAFLIASGYVVYVYGQPIQKQPPTEAEKMWGKPTRKQKRRERRSHKYVSASSFITHIGGEPVIGLWNQFEICLKCGKVRHNEA